MTPLEIKRLKLQLREVETARYQLEFKIEERLEDIARIKIAIQIQVDKETELAQKIKEAEGR